MLGKCIARNPDYVVTNLVNIMSSSLKPDALVRCVSRMPGSCQRRLVEEWSFDHRQRRFTSYDCRYPLCCFSQELPQNSIYPMRTSGIPHSAHVHDANSRKTGEWLNPNDRERGVLGSAIKKNRPVDDQVRLRTRELGDRVVIRRGVPLLVEWEGIRGSGRVHMLKAASRSAVQHH